MRWGVLVVLAGCGRIGFEAAGDAGDGVAGDGAAGDAVPLTCTREDFSAGLPATWTVWNDAPGFAASVVGEQVEITLVPNANGYAGTETLQPVDFTGGAMTVTVNAVATTPSSETYMAVYSTPELNYMIAHEAGVLYMSRYDSGTPELEPVSYEPTTHRSWRMRHDATTNEVVFATSRDGVQWSEHHRTAATIPVTAMFFELSAGTFGGGDPQPGTPRYDDYELCLP